MVQSRELLPIDGERFGHIRASAQQRAGPWSRELRTVHVLALGLVGLSMVFVCWAAAEALGGASRVASKSLRHSVLRAREVGDKKSQQGLKAAAANDPLAEFQPQSLLPRVPKQLGPSKLPCRRCVPALRTTRVESRVQWRTRGAVRGPRAMGMQTSGSDSNADDGSVWLTDTTAFKFQEPGSDTRWRALDRVFVLSKCSCENFTMSSIGVPGRDGATIKSVLVFGELDDAERYAGALDAQELEVDVVKSIEPSELAELISKEGLMTTFIAAGEIRLPPDERSANGLNYDAERARLDDIFGTS